MGDKVGGTSGSGVQNFVGRVRNLVLLCVDPVGFIGPYRVIGLVYISGPPPSGLSDHTHLHRIIGLMCLLDEQGRLSDDHRPYYVIRLCGVWAWHVIGHKRFSALSACIGLDCILQYG